MSHTRRGCPRLASAISHTGSSFWRYNFIWFLMSTFDGIYKYVCVCVCDMIRAALGTSHLKRVILFLTCTVWTMVIIMIWPLFRNMNQYNNQNFINEKPLNRIGIFWYHFTPRKLLYLMVSVNLVKFGPHGLSVFLGATLYKTNLTDGNNEKE